MSIVFIVILDFDVKLYLRKVNKINNVKAQHALVIMHR